MIAPVTQRWRAHRSSYRPAGEPIQTRAYEVAELAEASARAFVEHHHYSGSYPGGKRVRFGIHRGAELVGVAVFSQPWSSGGLEVIRAPTEARLELGRLVLLDDVPANGESWFVARCFEELRRAGVEGIVSFSDPEPRTDGAGAAVFPGHLGIVYRALNATFLGRAKRQVLRLLPDGRAFHYASVQKIRHRKQGWRYAAEQLAAAGAEPLSQAESAAAWLERWLPRVTRPLRHGGNLKYVWGLNRAVRRALPAGLPYPQWADLAAGRVASAAQVERRAA